MASKAKASKAKAGIYSKEDPPKVCGHALTRTSSGASPGKYFWRWRSDDRKFTIEVDEGDREAYWSPEVEIEFESSLIDFRDVRTLFVARSHSRAVVDHAISQAEKEIRRLQACLHKECESFRRAFHPW